MTKKKRRDCLDCIAYYNILGEAYYQCYQCGLGFEVMETLEEVDGVWSVVVRPYKDACEIVPQPKTKEEFIRVAEERGIMWHIEDVQDVEDDGPF